MNRGLYIVIQGPQGVGKSTQIVELDRRLKASGLKSRIMREPDSQTDPASRTIRSITQNPKFNLNTKSEVLLYNAARSQTLETIQTFNNKGVNCIVDHNYLTTLAVQYYGRGDIDDYEAINDIIRFTVGDNEPDLTVVLDAPIDELIKRKQQASRGEKFDNLPRDFLERARKGLLIEAKKRDLPIIDASKSIDDVAEQIWNLVSDVLKNSRKKAKSSSKQPASIGQILSNKQSSSLKTDDNGNLLITDQGKEVLSKVVTDVEGDVYAFKDTLPSTTVAAAMARLSRRGDDMRVTLLDEFLQSDGKDEELLRRVITAYGDDSVQQLATVQLVVENASNLLTKKLEWGRLASYLEQSTRYIFFDQKDVKGNFKYYTPKTLDAATARQYEETMNRIFKLYSKLVRSLTDHVRAKSNVAESEQDGAWKAATRAQACDAIRPVLPVATKATVGIVGSGQAIENMVMNLQADLLHEAREVGDNILKQARQVLPVFLERADKPDRGGATVAYRANTKQAMQQIADTKLSQNLSPQSEPVTLLDYWPRNELDLVPYMLFDYTDLGIEDLKQETSNWNYKTKSKVFNSYLGDRLNRRHKPGRALEVAHYSWELVCDYGIFRDLQRHRIVDDMGWQSLTPRYGYDVPELVEEAGLTSDFEKCFDLSLELYGAMQAAGFMLEAQYATLLGHKMRSKVTMNARESYHFIELRTAPQGHPGYRKLCHMMYEKLQEVHPLTAAGMKFVNKDEDAELTRLAAEKYTQYKLAQLDQAKAAKN
jgi:dTMP kinase